MRCDSCGCSRPTKSIAFYQNIGMLIARQSKTVEGDLCKPCINHFFWKLTLTTLVLGWWGMISFIVTPFFLLNNIVRFLGTIGMKTEDRLPDARSSAHPTLSLTAEARSRLAPLRDEMQRRLFAGEPKETVCGELARRAGVSAVQAELFADELV